MLESVYFQKLHPDAQKPVRAYRTDAGIDLKSLKEVLIPSFESRTIETGLSMKLPEDTCGMICSRSGLAAKDNLIVLNSPGIIDESYTGELKVILYNLSRNDYIVKKNDKITQLVIVATQYYPIRMTMEADDKEFEIEVEDFNFSLNPI